VVEVDAGALFERSRYRVDFEGGITLADLTRSDLRRDWWTDLTGGWWRGRWAQSQ